MDTDPKHRADSEARGWQQDDFSADLGHAAPPEPRTATHHEPVAGAAGDLTREERARLTILAEGTPLDGGSTYLDLDDRDRAPFTAEDGQVADAGRRLVSKRDVDYELWNRLIGREAERGGG